MWKILLLAAIFACDATRMEEYIDRIFAMEVAAANPEAAFSEEELNNFLDNASEESQEESEDELADVSYKLLGGGDCTGAGGAAVNAIYKSGISAPDCKVMCASLPSCAGYSFRPSNGKCRVHGSSTSTPSGWYSSFSSVATISGSNGQSGIACYVPEASYTRLDGLCTGPVGGQVNFMSKYPLSDPDCRAKCSSLTSCNGYSFLSKYGHCFVYGAMTSYPLGWTAQLSGPYSRISGSKPYSGASCYYKGVLYTQPPASYTQLEDGYCRGPTGGQVNYMFKSGMSDSSCKATCSELPSCAGYSFASRYAKCFVYGSMTSRMVPSGWKSQLSKPYTTISGSSGGSGVSCSVKNGYQPPVTRPPVTQTPLYRRLGAGYCRGPADSNINSIYKYGLSRSECEAKCSLLSSCRGYSTSLRNEYCRIHGSMTSGSSGWYYVSRPATTISKANGGKSLYSCYVKYYVKEVR